MITGYSFPRDGSDPVDIGMRLGVDSSIKKCILDRRIPDNADRQTRKVITGLYSVLDDVCRHIAYDTGDSGLVFDCAEGERAYRNILDVISLEIYKILLNNHIANNIERNVF